MNFVDSLSLSSGLRISKPCIDPAFFPLVPEKYITINTDKHQSKQWDHTQEFIDLLNPFLQSKNISIVELGWNEHQLQNVYSIKNAANPRQAAFVMQNSLLHVGPEGFFTQLASFYKKPFVSLFSNTTAEFSKPRWSKGDSTSYLREIIIESSRNNLKPSFGNEENPKTINLISAEEVCSKVLDLLSIKNDFSSIDVFLTGALYHSSCFEVVPNFAPLNDFLPNHLLNVRMDYHFNESVLPAFANNRKLSIISEKEISLQILANIRPSIEILFFKVTEDFSLDYLHQLKRMGITFSLIAKDGSSIPDVRLKFFDWKVEEEPKKEKKDLDNYEKICDTTRYKSSKILFSDGKRYSSKMAWQNNIESHEDEIVFDHPDFWEEVDHFKLYNIND